MTDDDLDDLRKTARAWHAARQKERDAMTRLDAAIRQAHARGAPQRKIAATAGINRLTVLRALGTPPPSRATTKENEK